VARNLLLYFEFFLILAVSLLLVWPQIQKLRTVVNENVPRISVIGFSQTDIQILQKILAGDKYESIAVDCGLSINTMKHRAQKLFEKLQVTDRTTFVTKYANRGAFLS
jgi:DNA-binding NarL/FixJ family response regulator